MEIRRLELVDFRNYERAEVELARGLNTVLGRNGQGKTNLLEAVYALSALGSHRSSTSMPMVRHGTDRAVVVGTGRVRAREVRVDVEIRRGAGVRARVNKVAIERYREGAAGFAAVLFSPEDLGLVKGGPDERRRFLDHVAAEVRPMAAVERLEFERVLRQRNGALKAAQANPRAARSLDVWDEQLVKTGALVARNRLDVLSRVRERAGSHYRDLVVAQEGGPSMRYRASWVDDLEPGLGADEIAGLLEAAITESRSKEVDRGVSLVGPQRDDLDLELDGEEVRAFSSQGEQRSIALALRLAERDVVAEVRGEDPILLLDDVFSELDDRRRVQLAELIGRSGQTIATTTGAEPLPFAASRVLEVEDGRVSDA